MKRFTIIFTVLLVLGFAGTLALVSTSAEFVPPETFAASGEDPDAPIWTMTMDELLSELGSQGLIDVSDSKLLGESGLCSSARKVSGAEFYWWDLESLAKDSQEYTAYKSLKQEGFIDLYGMGIVVNPVSNGPFAVLLTGYEGNVKDLEQAFKAIGQTGSLGGAAQDENAPIWDKNMDDILAYFVEEGFLSSIDDADLLAGGTATDARDINGACIYWWDLEKLEDGSAEAAAYASMNADGSIDLWNQGYIMAITPNGPFGLSVTYYKGDGEALLESFLAFGRE